MSVSEEIFNEFFIALQGAKEVPQTLIESLKKAEQERQDLTEEQLAKLIKDACADAG